MKLGNVIKELQARLKVMGDRDVVVVGSEFTYDLRYVIVQESGKDACRISLIPEMFPREPKS